jgi:NhaA family Na+:H+ antiporter
MTLPPRVHGKVAVRAEASPVARGFLARIAPFFAISEISGGPLLIAAVVALIATNSPWGEAFQSFWETKLSISVGKAEMAHSLSDWATNALLPVLFFSIGIEVKREFHKGLLSDWKDAAFPACGAIGGFIAPVLVYLIFNIGGPYAHGWGIVVTMDTAFTLAIVAMMGGRLPRSVLVLLLAFAAIDDIGGLLVIALVYSGDISWSFLAGAAASYGMIVLLLRLRAISSIPYVILGLMVWFFAEQSGVHPTIAGVLLGFLVPTSPRIPERQYARRVQEHVNRFQHSQKTIEDEDAEEPERGEAKKRREVSLGVLTELSHGTYEAAERVMRTVNPWISYVVLPVFALGNAGVPLSRELVRETIASPLALGIFLGLLIGKPIGFLGGSWLGVRAGLATLPDRLTWQMVTAIGIVAGLGFTISIFVAELAFPGSGPQSEEARLAILCASSLAGVAGYLAFHWAAAQSDEAEPEPESGSA